MFDTLNNPVFAVGVLLVGTVASIFIFKVFGSTIKSLFWKPKKPR